MNRSGQQLILMECSIDSKVKVVELAGFKIHLKVKTQQRHLQLVSSNKDFSL